MAFKKIIKDFKNFIRFKINEKRYHSIFFTENKYTFSYLCENFYLQRQKKKIALISLESFEINISNDFYIFETSFFRQIFFLSVRVKYLYSTTPDLNQSIFVKSAYKKTKYIYLQHSPVGLIHKYRNKAFYSFDAVQVINTFQYDDIFEIKEKFNLKIKIFKSKYGFIKFLQKKHLQNTERKILVAPTWNTNFYDDNLESKIINNLDKYKDMIFFRPHPMSLKNNEISINRLTNLGYKMDNNETLDLSNYSDLITDWSGIFIEFAIVKKNKPLLLNTKNRNRASSEINNKKIFEYYSRDLIGVTVSKNHIEDIEKTINLNNPEINKIEIENYFKKYFYN